MTTSDKLKRYTLLTGMTLGLATTITACDSSQETSSTPLVTDVAHTSIKKQTIGNCWLYAVTTWAESLHLSATENEINISESYWTWWYFYGQLISGQQMDEIQTGGGWYHSSNLINDHGYLLEGEFIEGEADIPGSLAQANAVALINEELKEGGRLADPENRSKELITSILDEAFGSDMTAATEIAHDASELKLGEDKDGNDITLSDSIDYRSDNNWQYASYAQVTGEDSTANLIQQIRRKKVLKRVMRALNDKKPVIITMMIDFAAFDKEGGEFNMETYNKAEEPGRQGGHMLVLEDYTVTNVPGIGEIGEGDVSDELKIKALSGDIKTLIAKNSWGDTVNGGYHRFNIDYLSASLPWKQGEDVSYYTTLASFILPPGY
jgi:hypothetical protein